MGGGAEKIEDKYFHAVFTRLGSMREKCLVRYTTYEDIFELYKMENNKIDYIHKETSSKLRFFNYFFTVF